MISGLVWLGAAVTATIANVPAGFTVLFFGGMLIFPIATLVVRKVFHRLPPSKENPGGLTVIETVFPMIGGFLAAWLILPHRIDFVFPICAIAVGGHYFGFRTAYGDKTYWLLALVMCVSGLAAIFFKFPPETVFPYVIAGIEIIFGVLFTWNGMSVENSTPVPIPGESNTD